MSIALGFKIKELEDRIHALEEVISKLKEPEGNAEPKPKRGRPPKEDTNAGRENNPSD